jgi:hypothetical protein
VKSVGAHQCSTIKPDGERCRGIATTGKDQCPAHEPDREEARRRAGRIANRGRRMSRATEAREIKATALSLAERVVAGDLEPGRVTAACQLYNCALRAMQTEAAILETEDLAKEVAEMRRRVEEAAS